MLPLFILVLLVVPVFAQAEYVGDLSTNPYAPNSTANPYGGEAPSFSNNSVTNQFSPYGSPFSNQSATKPLRPMPRASMIKEVITAAS